MPKLYETLPPARQLELAVLAKTPSRLADTFASFVGQFYDRSDFDRLARQASELYDADSPESAYHFRARLDRRLYDRFRDPVTWEVMPARNSDAA